MPLDPIPIPGFADPVSSISHLLGLAIFAVLGPFLIRKGGSSKAQAAFLATFYVATLLLLAMSAIFHLLERGSFAREEVLWRLDHAAIFLLIAGTLTTAHGIAFRGWSRWVYLIAVWIFAAAAIPLKMIFIRDMPEWLSLALYLGFGWMGLISGIMYVRRYGFRFIAPVFFGGVAYSIGAVVEFLGRPELMPGVFGPHELFHIAVLVGLGLHWYFIWTIADYVPADHYYPKKKAVESARSR